MWLIKKQINERTEEEAREEQEKKRKLKELAWEHIQAAQERFQEDTDDNKSDGAFRESELILSWVRQFETY